MADCQKIPYPTKAAAREQINHMRAAQVRFPGKTKASAKSNRKQYVYQCPKYGAFHLMTKNPKKYRIGR